MTNSPTDPPAVPPEAYEAGEQELAMLMSKRSTRAGWVSDLSPHELTRLIVDAAAPILRSLGVAEGRRRAAEAIRAQAAETTSFGYSAVRVAIDASDEHPFMIGLEWAARIAEGNTDA